jgi:TetR/AcrR family transcriptional regulator, mexJK operon transcriptional repressor
VKVLHNDSPFAPIKYTLSYHKSSLNERNRIISTDPPKASRGRPVDPGKREAILAATRDRLLRIGFEAVTMEGVAEDAGVSKVTVYRLFSSRETLVSELVGIESDRMEEEIAALLAQSGQAAGALTTFGTSLMLFLARPDVLALDARMQQAPQVFRPIVVRYFQSGPARLFDALIGMVAAVMKRHGEAPADAAIPTAHLLALWQTAIPMPVRLGLLSPPFPDEIESSVKLATNVFLAAYGLPISPPEAT